MESLLEPYVAERPNFEHEGDYVKRYEAAKIEERNAKEILKTFEKEYPKVLNESNLNDILSSLRVKKEAQKEDM